MSSISDRQDWHPHTVAKTLVKNCIKGIGLEKFGESTAKEGNFQGPLLSIFRTQLMTWKADWLRAIKAGTVLFHCSHIISLAFLFMCDLTMMVIWRKNSFFFSSVAARPESNCTKGGRIPLSTNVVWSLHFVEAGVLMAKKTSWGLKPGLRGLHQNVNHWVDSLRRKSC